MAVEQNPDLLNSNSEEEGDAFMAWALLSTQLNDLPDWAHVYFQKLVAMVEEFDPHEDDEIALTCQLEVPVLRSKKRKRLGAKSRHDYAHVFDWVDGWQRTEEVNLDQALWEYIDIHKLTLDEYETIKSAYHKVRRARLANLDQDRPHFTMSKTSTEGD